MLRKFLPFRRAFEKLRKTRIPITYIQFLKFKLFGEIVLDNYWYKHKNTTVSNSKRIFVGKNCLIGRPGCYIQGAGGVLVGDYVQFGPNVGVLSANHDLMDQHKYNTKPIIIGKYSWVG